MLDKQHGSFIAILFPHTLEPFTSACCSSTSSRSLFMVREEVVTTVVCSVCLPISGRRGQDVLLFPSLVLFVPHVLQQKGKGNRESRRGFRADVEANCETESVVRVPIFRSGDERLSNHPFVCWDKKRGDFTFFFLFFDPDYRLSDGRSVLLFFSSSSSLLPVFTARTSACNRFVQHFFTRNLSSLFFFFFVFFFRSPSSLSVPHRLTTHPVIAGSFLLFRCLSLSACRRRLFVRSKEEQLNFSAKDITSYPDPRTHTCLTLYPPD